MPRTRLNALLTRVRKHRRAQTREPATSSQHRKRVRFTRPGKARTGLLLWLLGVPIPLILLFFMIKGCVN